MSKQRKFFKLLAEEINNELEVFTLESLKCHLNEAISVLPGIQMKESLLQPSDENIYYLWNLLKPERKCSTGIDFVFFNETEEERSVNKILRLQSFEEKKSYLHQMALACPSGKVFKSLFQVLNEEANSNEVNVLYTAMKLFGSLNIGSLDLKVFSEIIGIFLSEMDIIYSTYKKNNATNECWSRFKDVIQHFLLHCHVKQKVHKDVFHEVDLKSYYDSLASVTALYVDVLLIVDGKNPQINDIISNMTVSLLGESLSHILDVFNQTFTLDRSTMQNIFPVLRKMLNMTLDFVRNNINNYIKFVCLAWKISHVHHKGLYLIDDILSSLLPPEDFLSYLSSVNINLVQDLRISGLSGSKITKKILECESEERIENLLDIVTYQDEHIIDTSTKKRKSDHGNDNETKDHLYFVDAKGDTGIVEECQEQDFTGSKSDKILQIQINSLVKSGEENLSDCEEIDELLHVDEEDNTTLDCSITTEKKSSNYESEMVLRSDEKRNLGFREVKSKKRKSNVWTSKATENGENNKRKKSKRNA
ncbi:uncharacterized protein LOC124434301 [Xenia sp. Carnegie-2017]|uniref:uncharacterized protein LOC124434301 n=1 Tax=Xenia sp. Carnegie-2017 TaxID=2897299 RepID=UPI001F04E6D7|nr:uncharacterized protein LOC124434301 [Xenia sp. Carnegie-2017]